MVPEGWKIVPLASVAEVRTGIAKNSQHKSADSVQMPYLRVANVQDGYLNLSEIKTITIESNDAIKYLLRDGDVLLTEGGDFDKLGRGTVWKAEIPECLHQNHIFVVRPSRNILLPIFLSALTGSSYGKSYFLKCSKQSTNLASINSTQLKEFPVLLPPINEQSAIIRILVTWDHAIDLTTQLIAAKKHHKWGLMQQLLTGKKRFADSHNWSWHNIGDLFRSVTRFERWDDEKVYVQAIVKRWSQGIETRPPLYGKQIKTKNLQVIRTGDFLISDIQASYGAMCMVDDKQDGLYVSNVYTILIPRNEKQVCTSYFDQFSRTSLMRHFVTQSSNGFKAERIRLSFVLDTFMQQKIYLPDNIAEQKRIADLLQLCDDEITLLNHKLALLKKQKQGLMQQLLTGKVRVKI